MKFVIKKTFVCGKKEEAMEVDVNPTNLKDVLLYLSDREIHNIRHLSLIMGNKEICSWNTVDLVCLRYPVKAASTKVVVVKKVKKPAVKAKPVKKAKVKK